MMSEISVAFSLYSRFSEMMSWMSDRPQGLEATAMLGQQAIGISPTGLGRESIISSLMYSSILSSVINST